jgi:uncharacterized Fe-S center protein
MTAEEEILYNVRRKHSAIDEFETSHDMAIEAMKEYAKACLERVADKVSYLDIHNMELVLDTITDEANLI